MNPIQSSDAGTKGVDTKGVETKTEALLPEQDLTHYRERWDYLQATFVDEPKRSVEDADALVVDKTRVAETTRGRRDRGRGEAK